jgi:hypothetical protein
MKKFYSILLPLLILVVSASADTMKIKFNPGFSSEQESAVITGFKTFYGIDVRKGVLGARFHVIPYSPNIQGEIYKPGQRGVTPEVIYLNKSLSPEEIKDWWPSIVMGMGSHFGREG